MLLCVAAVVLAGAVWYETRRPHGPNVLLITIDTLRADSLGVYGAGSTATPHIDRLASQGLVFDNVTVDVSTERSDVVADLRTRLLAWDESHSTAVPAEVVDAETLEKLRSLGYVH